jgi:anti-sigma factor RsiW
MSEAWPGGTAHPREELQDLLDGRLSGAGAEAVRAHMATCDVCQHEWLRLENGRAASAVLRADHDVPADLARAIGGALDGIDADDVNRSASTATVFQGRRWLMAGAAAAAVLALVVWQRQALVDEPRTVPEQVALDFEAVVDSGTLVLERRSAQAAELEAFFAEASGATTTPRVRVIDLAMMGFTLEGGRRHALGSVPSALYSYRTASGERIVCQMFEGRLDALPPTADVRESNGFTFRVFRERGVTLVFWQEGDIICVLASRLPVDEVVKLAFAKAMRPA